MRAFVALATLFWGPNRDLWCNATWSGLAGHGVGQSTQTLFEMITDVQFIGSWYSIDSCYSWVEYSWTAQVNGDNIKVCQNEESPQAPLLPSWPKLILSSRVMSVISIQPLWGVGRGRVRSLWLVTFTLDWLQITLCLFPDMVTKYLIGY